MSFILYSDNASQIITKLYIITISTCNERIECGFENIFKIKFNLATSIVLLHAPTFSVHIDILRLRISCRLTTKVRKLTVITFLALYGADQHININITTTKPFGNLIPADFKQKQRQLKNVKW